MYQGDRSWSSSRMVLYELCSHSWLPSDLEFSGPINRLLKLLSTTGVLIPMHPSSMLFTLSVQTKPPTVLSTTVLRTLRQSKFSCAFQSYFCLTRILGMSILSLCVSQVSDVFNRLSYLPINISHLDMHVKGKKIAFDRDEAGQYFKESREMLRKDSWTFDSRIIIY